MKRWLQRFSFKASPYERPNQAWVCGHACEGKACLVGPTADGTCRATAECRPLRKGDRWTCTRGEAQGGRCSEGPLPDGSCCRPITKCTPFRSIRAWRGLVSVAAFSISLAAVLFILGSERHGNHIVSPGGLSFAHASAKSNCSDCHEGLAGAPATWLVGTNHVATNGRLCLDCHNMGSAPFSPHALPADRLRQLTSTVLAQTASAKPVAAGLLPNIIGNRRHDAANQQLDCSVCHQEHQGASHDLRTISDQQCQSCHAVQFAGFAAGHPPFPKETFTRRTRIIFDHVSHLRHHFREEPTVSSAPKSCLDCHETDLKGDSMVLKSFEATCAHCHEDQIKGKGAVKTGFTVVGVPRLDDRTMVDKYSIGEWPEDAEQPLTPFLRFVLAGDPKAAAALETLADTDLSDIAKTETNKLAAAQTLAWSIKGLIFDLETRGQEALLERLAESAGRPLTSQEQESVTAFVASEIVQTAFGHAFPHLQEEVVAYRANGKAAETDLTPSPPLAKKTAVKPLPPDIRVSSGGWYSPEASFALMYRPRGHSDRFLTDWMNLTANTNATRLPDVSAALFAEVAGAKAPGLCVKCHSVDARPDALVNWRGKRPDRLEHGFNRFDHSAHLSLLQDQGCQTCHSMREDAGPDTYASAFAPGQRDAFVAHSNFGGIKQETCATCHRPALVAANCTTCHNYHVGRFQSSVVMSGNMDGLAAPSSKK